MSAPVASETRSPFSASSEISACSHGGLRPAATSRWLRRLQLPRHDGALGPDKTVLAKQGAELVAVQGDGVRLVIDSRATDVGGG